MIFDKESILYIKDFIENKYETTHDKTYESSNFNYIIEPINYILDDGYGILEKKWLKTLIEKMF